MTSDGLRWYTLLVGAAFDVTTDLQDNVIVVGTERLADHDEWFVRKLSP